jgi:hypothetical protein
VVSGSSDVRCGERGWVGFGESLPGTERDLGRICAPNRSYIPALVGRRPESSPEPMWGRRPGAGEFSLSFSGCSAPQRHLAVWSRGL